MPADTFQLFLATSVLNSRFGTLAAAMHMVVIAVVGTYALRGQLRLSAGRVLRVLSLALALTAAVVAGLAVAFRAIDAGAYEGDRVAREMGLLRAPAEPALVQREVPAEPLPPPTGDESLLAAIRARGRLRVGWVDGQMPYSFVNARGELVGFDVEMAYALASELGVALELAPVPPTGLARALEAGCYDLVMGGVYVATRRTRTARLLASLPRRDARLRRPGPSPRASSRAPNGFASGRACASPCPICPTSCSSCSASSRTSSSFRSPMRDLEGFLTGQGKPVDAVCLTAERGSFLTLLHPAFSVAVPHPLEIRLPLAYPVARHDLEMTRFLATWIDLKRKDGTITALYDHWILGRVAGARRARGSMHGKR